MLVVAGVGAAAPLAAAGKTSIAALGLRKIGLAMGLRQMAVPIGAAASALVLPRIAGAHGLGFALLLLSGLTGVAIVLGRPVIRQGDTAKLLLNVRPRLAHLRPLLGASGLLTCTQWTFVSYLPLYLHDIRGWSAVHAGDVVMVLLLGTAAIRLLVGWLSDRNPRAERALMLTIGFTGSGLALAAHVVSESSWILAPLFAAALVASAWAGLAHGLAARNMEVEWVGRSHGRLNTVLYLSGATWAQVIVRLADGYGWRWCWLVAGCAGLTACLLLMRIKVPPSPLPRCTT
jgi:nitrate/nitrite transporter NarK